ncbi:MAG: hypothetical protein HYS36_15140 [Candidatus Rokubacteria bacterium]|nr:hypothetical protein [Candidatus Rokubacteria bacterium]
MTSPVVDTLAAQEFMREALAKITLDELGRIADQLEAKHARFRALLDPAAGRPPAPDAMRAVLRSVFATRRRVGELFAQPGAEPLGLRIHELLAGRAPLRERFQAFVDGLDPLPQHLRFDLASECLHYTDPTRYWLWTRWVWDPATRTGALPLVTMEEFDLDGGSAGASYLRVGEATAFVHETGQAAGFTRIGRGGFGADVYLACVYGVYVFTTIRMRITQEFNRVIPPLPELCRRLLGVHRMEAQE